MNTLYLGTFTLANLDTPRKLMALNFTIVDIEGIMTEFVYGYWVILFLSFVSCEVLSIYHLLVYWVFDACFRHS